MTESPSLRRFLSWADIALNFERTPEKDIFWLDTMNFFCGRLGHPERAFRSVHVAGSKGKGSVSCFAANILHAAGHRTGLYISPHITDFSERISLAGAPFGEEVYERSVDELISCVDGAEAADLPGGRRATWFELVTLLAFLCFRNAGCEWAVIEVGLGGRLDATNVITPEVCCITPIELEHTEFLGGTVREIAFEKAGIMKEGVPVFVSGQPHPEAMEMLLECANGRKSPVFLTAEHSEVYEVVSKSSLTNGSFSYKKLDMSDKMQNERLLYDVFSLESEFFSRPLELSLRLPGRFQAENAAQAALAVKRACPAVTEDSVESGVMKAWLPGRFEVFFPGAEREDLPLVVMDGAHTPASVRLLLENWSRLSMALGKSSHLLFACASDKDVEGMASLLAGRFTSVTLTRPGASKGCDFPGMCRAFAGRGMRLSPEEDFRKAVPLALEGAAREDAALLVTGSFYLVAEVREALRFSGARAN